MGIKGLHRLIADECVPVHLREFSGQVAGIDGFCWLYAAKSVAEKGEGNQNFTFKDYLRRKIKMFLDNGVKPVLVLDGRRLLAKAETHAKRVAAQKRKSSGKFAESPFLGPSAALRFIEVAREMKIDHVVSPYESDAQLAYSKVDFVVTEDADLLVYGCQRVLFKLGWNGVGRYFESEKLADCLGFKKEDFTLDKFRHIAILSGCDYLENVRGFGIKHAIEAVKKYPTGGIDDYLVEIEEKVGRDVIPDNYKQKFLEAEFVFKHQLVFDIQSRKVVPVSPYPDPLPFDDITFAGEIMNDVLALELAFGNLDPFTLDQNEMEYFNVDAVGEDSIWAEGHFNDSWIKPIVASGPLDVDNKEKINWECHCGDLFDEPGELKTHLMTHKRTKTCSICGYVARLPSGLIPHLRIHTGEKPFVCQVEGCGAAFREKRNLVDHKFRHSEERNYACQAENCTATFKTSGDLRQHKRFQHSGRRPFSCDFSDCDATFHTKQRLDRHKLTHGTERAYSCTTCGQTFDRKDHLKRHATTHSAKKPRFLCTTCGQTFDRKDSLKRHAATHSAKKPRFVCKTCKSSYSRSDKLRAHIKKNHL